MFNVTFRYFKRVTFNSRHHHYHMYATIILPANKFALSLMYLVYRDVLICCGNLTSIFLHLCHYLRPANDKSRKLNLIMYINLYISLEFMDISINNVAKKKIKI